MISLHSDQLMALLVPRFSPIMFVVYLKNNSYFQCLRIDFSKAFGVVDHEMFMTKVCVLDVLSEMHRGLSR